MSIQYDLYDTPDIQQTGDAQPLHPRVVFKGTVDQEEFLDRVHKFTGISRSLLAGAMQSFQNELRDLIANGWIVELGDIGYFSVSLKGPRVMKKKDVHAQSIELKNVNFRVSSQFKKEVGQQMRLERGESMTRHHGKGHSEEECLTIINQHLNNLQEITAGFAFSPQSVLGTAKECNHPGFLCFGISLFVHKSKHKHLRGSAILNNGRNKSPHLFEINFHFISYYYILTFMPS